MDFDNDMDMNVNTDDSNNNVTNGDSGPQWDPTDPTSIALDTNLATTSADPTAILTTSRRTQVKLTTERLLTEKGLPYLLKNGPKNIKISKKKKTDVHGKPTKATTTYDNLTNITRFYQIWAHQLYPKAKFKDFLKLAYTLGKTDKNLRNYRIELFQAEMDKDRDDDHDTTTTTTTTTLPKEANTIPNNNTAQDGHSDAVASAFRGQSLFVTDENISENDASADAVNHVSPHVDTANNTNQNESQENFKNAAEDGDDDDDDDDDDLYSISANQSRDRTKHRIQDDEDEGEEDEKEEELQSGKTADNHHDEEMELLKELDELNKNQVSQNNNDDEFEEDQDALEVMQEFGF
ncbi:Csm3p NDAI_0G04770 [Naumovozyma dairenensis CBS 421]|uniref:Chromosome segregation in meiosis protein n=1 Tax=Naumovozyma dairenensis (strain ATCC 10597 / BCRC 20456 / CBS 421 / NBRC 0211 / NRRL Y-12639) TaxID=1071378 RepID=J7SBP8_NAUDC|nr:hypothetical protein NDAI_0G04770 [Naumovozyma dairenensis CBS 421]CCK73460.1 hypothetical protein NDAI_0G04770 [Naumovozyma dairenensis CBS 421]